MKIHLFNNMTYNKGKLILTASLTSNEGNHAFMNVLIIYHLRRIKLQYDNNRISMRRNQI